MDAWRPLPPPRAHNIARFIDAEGAPESAADGEIDQFFRSIDTDGGGKLEYDELKSALKLLQDAGKRTGGRTKELEKLSKEQRAAARTAQSVFKRLLKEDEKAAAEEKERLERDAREKAERAEAAKAAKAAAAAAKADEEAKKKAEFAARVAAKSLAVAQAESSKSLLT